MTVGSRIGAYYFSLHAETDLEFEVEQTLTSLMPTPPPRLWSPSRLSPSCFQRLAPHPQLLQTSPEALHHFPALFLDFALFPLSFVGCAVHGSGSQTGTHQPAVAGPFGRLARNVKCIPTNGMKQRLPRPRGSGVQTTCASANSPATLSDVEPCDVCVSVPPSRL